MFKFVMMLFLMTGLSYADSGHHEHEHEKKEKSCHKDKSPECIPGERVVNGDFETDVINSNWALLEDVTGWESRWTRASTCHSQDKRESLVEIQAFPKLTTTK